MITNLKNNIFTKSLDIISNKIRDKLYKYDKIKIGIPSNYNFNDLMWIDNFISSIKEYVYVREDENLLIILPNQVYKLNNTATELLSFLLEGNSIKSYLDSNSLNLQQIEAIIYFICDFRSLLKGCFIENELRKSIEVIPYNRYFYNYPILSEIALTYACNALCKFCYLDCNKNNKNALTTEELKTIIYKIRNEAKVPSVSFTGGEPTLRNDLPELIKFARSINLRVNLITNGILIDQKLAKTLKDAGLNSAQVSLEAGQEAIHESLTQVKGSFYKTLSAIKYLKEYNIFTHTNTTINQLNKNYLFAIIDIAKQIGTNRLSMNMLMPCGNSVNNPELWISYSEIGQIVNKLRLYSQQMDVEFMWYSPTPLCLFNPIQYGLGNKTCAAAHGLLSIDPNGNILPCSSLNISLGNLLENNFNEIWFSNKAIYYRLLEFAPKLCKECSYFEICGSACPIYFEKFGLNEINNKIIK